MVIPVHGLRYSPCPVRSNNTGQFNRVALIQKSAVLKAQAEDPSDLLLQVEVDPKDSFALISRKFQACPS